MAEAIGIAVMLGLIMLVAGYHVYAQTYYRRTAMKAVLVMVVGILMMAAGLYFAVTV